MQLIWRVDGCSTRSVTVHFAYKWATLWPSALKRRSYLDSDIFYRAERLTRIGLFTVGSRMHLGLSVRSIFNPGYIGDYLSTKEADCAV